MMRNFYKSMCFCLLALVTASASVSAQALKGFVSYDSVLYNSNEAGGKSVSRFSGQIETTFRLNDKLTFQTRLFETYNPEDSDGNYVDPTIAKLSYSQDNWTIFAGYDIVYWGVVESQKIVNIINQRDQLRTIEGTFPLGQPMIGAVFNGLATRVEAYVLPKFIPLNFGSNRRRLGLTLPVDDEAELYEDTDAESHVDFALRVSGASGDLEYGAFVFDGTLRQPDFKLNTAAKTLQPYYRQGIQYGVELQYTTNATLFKFEGRQTNPDTQASYQNVVYGIEHVIGAPFGTRNELVLYLEHNWDSRGELAPNVFQNDLFVGARLNISNGLGTSIRVGGYYDLDYQSVFASALVETRLTDSLSLQARAYLVDASNPADTLTGGRNLDQLALSLKWSF